MSSLPKGESMSTKLVELFANRVVERRNMIMLIQEGELSLRVLEGVNSGGVFEFYELFTFLSFSWLFFIILVWFAAFCAFCWSCGFSFY
jgi:hypothetical protein